MRSSPESIVSETISWTLSDDMVSSNPHCTLLHSANFSPKKLMTLTESKLVKSVVCAAAVAALGTPIINQTQAALFKIDFGQLENERPPVDANGDPIMDNNGNPLPAPANLIDWTVLPTWTFADPLANVTPGSASAIGTPNAAGTEVTWSLIDSSSPAKTNVTITIMDNKALAESLTPDAPPYMTGQTANNPTKEGIDVVYDGVRVPFTVKDDYLYRSPDTAGTESLMRIANLDPGTYNVTVFEGRTTDSNGRFGKIWVDGKTITKEPATQNTGNYSGVDDSGNKQYLGQPRTSTVTLKAGEYLWFADMEDNSGGISGMIIRSVDPVDSPGLFKVDFGQLENERVQTALDGTPKLDPDGVEVGAPAPLKDWNVIPTWTYADPNANVVPGSASISGTPSADGTEVTWKLTDFSKDGNANVTLTIKDNKALAESVAPDAPPYMTGQTANNPTKEGIAVVYDGVLVPAIVKDDYIYRVPDTGGTESLLRFSGLKPGKYNVTVFEGRTSDSNGRHGKLWVDGISGSKEPAAQNTGNYSGVGDDGTVLPFGQPRTTTVDIKAGEYLWFAEMEDGSGGISGIIIRGLPSAPAAVELQGSSTVKGPFTTVSNVIIDTAAKSIKVPATGRVQFFRVQGSDKITSSSLVNGILTITYQ